MSASNQSQINLSCADSPFAIASGVSGFWTTLVALGIAYYAFYSVVISAPESFAAYCLDISLFQLQLMHIQKDLQYERQMNGDPQEPEEHEILMIREALHEGSQVYTKANNLKKQLDLSMDAAVRTNRQFSVRRLVVGFKWWSSQKAQATDLAAEIARHRSHLSFSERHLTRRYITFLHRDVHSLRNELKAAQSVSSSSTLQPASSNGRSTASSTTQKSSIHAQPNDESNSST